MRVRRCLCPKKKKRVEKEKLESRQFVTEFLGKKGSVYAAVAVMAPVCAGTQRRG